VLRRVLGRYQVVYAFGFEATGIVLGDVYLVDSR
jgi:hypothetical protein